LVAWSLAFVLEKGPRGDWTGVTITTGRLKVAK